MINVRDKTREYFLCKITKITYELNIILRWELDVTYFFHYLRNQLIK